ncbi:hypothetical protein K9N68_23085 [Kovacikia minuta CCNUW1]|uniref:hypothetical protein n=1 Tax=Kovacikia minuta TaxID=2931930 RepID=UPI001CC981C3|nr:hypothetical protein [Kovacikia minuta]UBF24555.1 hypothetical protein K9N68_23085 [Kovacikia minuta CCNUW1]
MGIAIGSVVILVDSASDNVTSRMVSALEQAVLSRSPQLEIQVMVVDTLNDSGWDQGNPPHRLLCPLTFNLPNWLDFSGTEVFRACRNVAGLRQQVAQWNILTGTGDLWLPIALTARGPLYGEVIGTGRQDPAQVTSNPSPPYFQPVHLGDPWRQPLYGLGQRLLQSLLAPPAVYLMQFGFQDQSLCFDRLFPFPAAPAIASLNVQIPDLFACHWLCMTKQPIFDLLISPSSLIPHPSSLS